MIAAAGLSIRQGRRVFPTVKPVSRTAGAKTALTPHRYKKSHSVFVRISRFRCALTGTLEFFPVESTDKRQFAQFGVL